jgi:DNA polymerase-1
MLIGRDPGQKEDKLEKVFIGRSGDLLNEILYKYGINRDDVYVTNVVKCGTPKTNVDPTKKEMKCCRPYLIEEITKIKPTVIVTMGGPAMYAVLGRSKISDVFNHIFHSEEFDAKVIPTFHPAYVLRDPSRRKFLEAGIDLAVKELGSKEILNHPFSKTKYLVVETEEQAVKIFNQLERAPAFSIDLETSSLSFIGTKILCVQLSWREGYAAVIPWDFFDGHPEFKSKLAYYLVSEEKVKIAHNIKFEMEQLLAKGMPIKGPYFDTYVAHGLIDDNGEHDLGTIVLEYTTMGNYWMKLERFKKQYCQEHKIKIEDFSYAFLPKSILYPYGASDADATFRLYEIFLSKLKEESVAEFWNNYSLPFIPVIVEMEYRGIRVDRQRLKVLLDACTNKLRIYMGEISGFAVVKQYEEWKAKRQMLKEVYKLRARWASKKTLMSRFPERKDYVRKYLKAKPFEFNMNSSVQLRELFCDVLGYASPEKTAKEQDSVSGVVLEYFVEAGDVGAELAAAMLKYRKLAVFTKTFVKAVYEKSAKDGRIHTSYIQTHAVTGRLSSRDPNLQNLTRDENLPSLHSPEELWEYIGQYGEFPITPRDFKQCFLVDPGYVFIKADLAQAEFRVWANMSDDEDMIADIAAGLDIHRRTASELFGIPPEEVTKHQRDAAKGGTFGMMYGIGDATLAKNFGISEEQAGSIREIFSSRYRVAARWLQKQIDFAHANEYVVSFLGRKRRLPMINDEDQGKSALAERQARNSPIQGAASDMNNAYTVAMLKLVRGKGLEIYPVATTHDEVVFAVPDNPDVVKDRIADYANVVATTFPNLKCKMSAEFKVGYSIGGAKTIKL